MVIAQVGAQLPVGAKSAVYKTEFGNFTDAGGIAEGLAKRMGDEEALTALYERTLARKPKLEELVICKRYLGKVSNREEAYEDIFWSLINSTEFLIKK